MGFFAHLALQNHNILPSDFMALPVSDRAFIIASDLVNSEAVKRRTKM